MSSMSKPILTQAEIKRRLRYEDGVLYWIHNGKVAGCIDKPSGYHRIKINYVLYLTHRVVWLYHHGSLPKVIDHINHNRADNRIENLNNGTAQDNLKNLKRNDKANNIFMGVKRYNKTNPWRARITINNKSIHLGYYDSLEEAISMRLTANDHFGFHDNHGL